MIRLKIDVFRSVISVVVEIGIIFIRIIYVKFVVVRIDFSLTKFESIPIISRIIS